MKQALNQLLTYFGVALLGAASALCAQTLDKFYVLYPGPQYGESGYRTGAFALLPALKLKNDRPEIVFPIQIGDNIGIEPEAPHRVWFTRLAGSPQTCQRVSLPWPIAIGATVSRTAPFSFPVICPGEDPFPGQNVPRREITEDFTFGAPQRRVALDGGQYDASAMVVQRRGQPWATLYWGYRLGLVESTFDWKMTSLAVLPELSNWPFESTRLQEELLLRALPPPFIEDDVVEYVNRADFPNQPGGQYFYAVRADDKTLLDSIPAWQRSGKSFKSGGYVSACRFYGGKNGGPNTHFYSADDKECDALKKIPQLSYEGQTFAVNVPLPGAAVNGVKPCPVDSKPLYRVYNNASASNGRFVSNHRYLTEKADVAAVVAQGWVDEGQVMCVPG
jgi:hypothetical protein